MPYPHITDRELEGRVIDGHSHAGVSLTHYARMDYPYAQTIEGLHAQQLRGGVDVNVVFPLSSDLYFDMPRMLSGHYARGRRPVSPVPYQVENELLLREIFDYCPESSRRFLPFLCADPAREARAQVLEMERLLERYPVYGLKINPATCQAPVEALLGRGRPILDFARERRLPVLLHSTSVVNDAFSHAREAFRVIEANPDLRFCLAHCILFSRPYLDRALHAPNVWVDTAAFTIQVALCRELTGSLLPAADRIDADFQSVDNVFAVMCERYGKRLIWGSDSPAYSYICRRKANRDQWQEFHYKALYDDEVRLLRGCTPELYGRISGRNTRDFLLVKG